MEHGIMRSQPFLPLQFPTLVLPLAILLLLALPPAPGPLGAGALAQEAEIEASGFPRDMVDRLIRIVNDPGTLHYRGDTVIPRDSLVTGNMVVMGSLELAGEVDGDVIVVVGDAELRAGSWIRGDITVVDGELRNDDMGRIEGLAAQASRAVSRSVPGTRVTGRDPGVSVSISQDRDRGASSHFALRVTDHNRVEGFQVMAGPVLTTGGDNPFRTTALLIWRSESVDGPRGVDRTGFDVRMEQFLGGQRAFRVGGGVHSRVSPVEAWGLSDKENALASFFLTTDHRDHFERRGWTAFLRATPGSLPLDASLEFHREEHGSLAAGDPWTLFRGSRAWREQPLVAEGTTRALVARASLDTRDERREPSGGWFAEGSVRRNLGGTLLMPPAGIQAPGNSATLPVLGPELDARFTTGMLDLRRYNSVGRGGRFNPPGLAAPRPHQLWGRGGGGHPRGGGGGHPGWAAGSPPVPARPGRGGLPSRAPLLRCGLRGPGGAGGPGSWRGGTHPPPALLRMRPLRPLPGRVPRGPEPEDRVRSPGRRGGGAEDPAPPSPELGGLLQRGPGVVRRGLGGPASTRFPAPLRRRDRPDPGGGRDLLGLPRG
ncbi:MAG: hypothetical protein EA421_05285 [Gemmatimonadales bacterium]|nr:MAG: hypothetical protein EA421_05285 [Gemmatimonadales bacterium]